ncbi:putative flavonol 3-O-glucosyltransferase [Rosa chinensis]|uniref:Putative flavonol 3-O-glucosyltransferase n=1 Tax=Rosa chinensis TaxID=74649 RepID=A0A2P6S0N7_ROSCH|nr:putative flavonol 3-O-glucosyltransferase [Rosa chinensis]
MPRSTFSKTFVESHKPYVRDAVAKLAESADQLTPRLAGFVVDMVCATMIDVANEFGVPTYIFFTSNACFLGLVFHLQTLADEHDVDVTELKDSEAELFVPSFVNPVPTKALPRTLMEREGAALFANLTRRFREAKGILVNTFWELESHALRTLSSYGETPPVYPVGPILKLKSEDEVHVDPEQAGKKKSDILKWLDDQLPSSVVFLCFGSRGSFGEDQVKEMACALEQSGHRFLWSLRRPPPKGKITHPSDYADPTAVLPDEFIRRTAEIGKVIGWAPQVDVLAHPAIGGFVSHCWWNSILESLWFGVPIATWPMYAEQQMNAFEMVREWGLAVKISVEYGSVFHSTAEERQLVLIAQDIERGIREVMEPDSTVRKRVKEMSEISKRALMDGGSSSSSLGRFIDEIFL